MLLIQLTINSVVNYLSVEGYALTHNWKPRVLDFNAPTLAIPSDHGGYAKITFGNVSFNPAVFATDWPPPIVCPVSIYYTDTDEAAMQSVFSGTAYLSSFDRESITYALYYPNYGETITSPAAYNDTLNNVITSILSAITEITTIDTTYARVSSPNVTYTTSSNVLAITLASNIAEFYSHLIYIAGSTAYLVDMKIDNGSWTLTEYGFFAYPTYFYKAPTASVTCGAVKRFSSYPYGVDLPVTAYHTTGANITAACDDILAIENLPRVRLDVPMIAGNFPALGEKIIIPDTANVANLSSWIRVRKLAYDFINNSINVEGEGAIAAA
jgi:hypothetical protein